jgi:hypothetical protein
VNPAKLGATRFSGAIKFPAPESDMLCTMTYYNSRKDVISAQDDQSRPYNIDLDSKRPDEKIPSELSLYEIDVAAYPSLPEVLSTDVLDILDTKLSGTSVSLRRELYTIEISSIDSQAPGYTMEEIGKLERRIATLEYYANLSETEGEIKDRTIPSSVDSTLERFKFGFFVDDFSDDSFTNVESLEQNSTFFSGLLLPASETHNVVLNMSEDTKSRYVSFFEAKAEYDTRSIISQPNATDGPVIPQAPPVPVPTVCNASQFISNRNTKRSSSTSLQAEENTFLMSSLTSSHNYDITIEFDVYSGNDRFEILQSTSGRKGTFTEIHNSTTTQPTNLTTSRKRILYNKNFRTSLGGRFTRNWTRGPNFTQHGSGATYGVTNNTGNYWTRNIGKMTFDYKPGNGRYIKVRVVKGSPHHCYFITYPRDCADTVYVLLHILRHQS